MEKIYHFDRHLGGPSFVSNHFKKYVIYTPPSGIYKNLSILAKRVIADLRGRKIKRREAYCQKGFFAESEIEKFERELYELGIKEVERSGIKTSAGNH